MDENKTNDIVREEEQPVLKPENTNEEQAQQTEEAAEVSGEEVGVEEPSSSGGFIKKLFSRKNIKKTIAVILLVLIIGGGVYGYFRYTSPESIALRYANATIKYEGKNMIDYYAYDYKSFMLYDYKTDSYLSEDEFFENASDEYDSDIATWNDYFKANADYMRELLEDYYGSFDAVCEVTRVKDISERKMSEDYKDSISLLEKRANFDFDKVEDGKEITIKCKYETEDEGIERSTYTALMVKISGSWKVLDWSYNTEK